MPIRKFIEQCRIKDFSSNPGETTRIEKELVIEDGQYVAKVTGVIDIQEEIDSYRDSVDIHSLVNRFMHGDESAINRAQAFYDDVSELPVKLQDVLAVNSRGVNAFEMLPVEIRELYGNDYLKFVSNPEIFVDYVNRGNPQNVENVEEKKNDVEN